MLAAAATMFVSCNKITTVSILLEKPVTFEALPVVETKTAFGPQEGSTYPTLWTENDSNVEISLNFATPKDATVTPSVDNTTATLKADFADDETGSYTFYALSPKVAYQNSLTTNRWGFDIATSQTPISGSVDEKAQILAAKSATLGSFPTEPINMTFSHVTAYACMTLTNLVDLGGETINSIAVTAGSNIAGRWYYYTDTNTVGEWSSSATISINASSVDNIMFALAPVDLNGKSFKVVVNTTGGTITKEITWPSGKAFIAGHVAKFNFNMSGATLVTPKVYELVKDVENLTNNSKVIIVGAETDTAISTTQNTNNRGQAAVDKDGDTITDPADNVEVFSVSEGTVSDSYSFLATTAAGYIYAAASDANNMKTEAEKSANSSFAVTINSSTGEATVVAQGTNTRNHLRHNDASSLFSCYASSSSVTEKVAFYKLTGSGDAVRPKVSIAGDIEAEVDDDDIVITWTNPGDVNVAHYLVTCTGQSDQEVDPADGGYIFEGLSNGMYTITVTAIASNSTTHRNSSTWTSDELKVGSGGVVTFVVGTDFTTLSQINSGVVKDGVTLSCNTTAYYSPLRVYSNNTVTVSGSKIVKVVFTGSTDAYIKTWSASDSGSCSISGSKMTWTKASPGVNTVTFTQTSSAQARLTQVEVTYE